MPVPFSRTLRSLEEEGLRPGALALLIATPLLGAWLIWFLLAPISVYRVGSEARVEVDRATHRVEAPAPGQVKLSRLELGLEVAQGDLLLALDDRDRQLALAEGQARQAALGEQLRGGLSERSRELRAFEHASSAAALALEEAASGLREAEAEARLAREEHSRMKLLRESGLASELELLQAEARVDQAQAAAEGRGLAAQRLRQELHTAESERRARLDRLERQAKELEGAIAAAAIGLERLQAAIDEHQVRAPVGGVLAQTAALEAGSYVAQGELLAIVVRQQELKVVAWFRPEQVTGRIRPGQPARLRLEGFPWPQYGTVAATVRRLASEAEGGRLRVELEPNADLESRIPLTHGLQGSVEILIERASPATLVLRTVGRRLTRVARAPDQPSVGITGRR